MRTQKKRLSMCERRILSSNPWGRNQLLWPRIISKALGAAESRRSSSRTCTLQTPVNDARFVDRFLRGEVDEAEYRRLVMGDPDELRPPGRAIATLQWARFVPRSAEFLVVRRG